MTERYRTIFKIRAATSCNVLIYFIKRFWIVGKEFPDSLYKEGSLKTVVTMIALIIKGFYGILKKAAYVLVMVWLPVAVINDLDFLDLKGFGTVCFYILFWLSCVSGPLQDSLIFAVKQEKFIAVRYMRIRPAEYIRNTLPAYYLGFSVSFLLPLLLLALIAGMKPFHAFVMLLHMVSFRLLGESFQVWLWEHTKKVFSRNTVIVWITIGLCAAAAYIPVVQSRPVGVWGEILFTTPAMLVSAVILGAAFWYLMWGYPNYDVLVRRTLDDKYLASNRKKAGKESQFRDVQMDEKDLNITVKSDKRLSRKKGYDYFNGLFFSRNRRQLFRPVIYQLIAIGVVFVAVIIARLMFPAVTTGMLSALPSSLPFFVFIMYLISVAPKACKAMFYNCDISLLRYGFYRKPRVILKNFGIRLRYVAGYNLIVAAAICAASAVLMLFTGSSILTVEMAAFIAAILLLSVFYSVHHLFLYYIFQPYTTQLDIKNPFFRFLNAVVYMVSYFCLQIRNANFYFTLGVLVITIIYIVLALILIYRFSPKTFRVK